jgi:hypothetical protein
VQVFRRPGGIAPHHDEAALAHASACLLDGSGAAGAQGGQSKAVPAKP